MHGSRPEVGQVHSPEALRYRPEIDGLRALAVLPVILFHAGVTFFSGGFVGVDVFFVISGFLITGILYREISAGKFSILNFYERRIRRLFPALFAMLAASSAIGWFILLPDEFAAFGRQILATCLFMSNILFWSEDGYFDAESATKPLLHTWSLAVEEQYYIIFPLLLWLMVRYARSAIRPIVMLGIVGSLVVSELVLHRFPSTAFFMLPTRAWELLIGALVALIPAYSGRYAAVLAWAGVGAILIPVLTFQESMLFPGIAALPPCAGAAAILWASRGTSCAVALSNRGLRFFGLISYSLYLWHWPIIVFLGLKFGMPMSPDLTVVAILLSLAVATASWRFVERPLRKGGGKPFVWSFGGACLTAGMSVAAILIVGNGLPARFTSMQNRMVDLSIREGAAMEAAYRCGAAHKIGIRKKVGVCDVGPGGRPRLVILGDSEAMALKPAFSAALERSDIPARLISKPGCPPLLGLDRVETSRGCAAASAAMAAYVRAVKPAAIILVANWRNVLSAKNTIFAGRTSYDAASRLDNVTRALSRTVAVYRSMGVRIGIVRSLPGATTSVGRAVARSSLAPLHYTLADHRAAFVPLNRAIDALRPDAIVDPADITCRSLCAVTDAAGTPLYWDASHPGAAGNAVLEPMLATLVTKLFNGHTAHAAIGHDDGRS
ncbi:acyltransferase family protein [Sphingomonas sp. NFR15]|uniref:acyltransferase family protein n=1 Tax=Sphingomonas sp. NFR15 TaxID=1566282 RepID=UPI00088C91B3|nr:acyltransferase family protein [Sphingomonas sp. NFR15]SDA17254.1 Peptidoglycan/LPS O-acetylase OafA/YrhL, contains acyltransferase and SGNH-hydrolase domains [Sphingomonas sp. NFR15]